LRGEEAEAEAEEEEEEEEKQEGARRGPARIEHERERQSGREAKGRPDHRTKAMTDGARRR